MSSVDNTSNKVLIAHLQGDQGCANDIMRVLHKEGRVEITDYVYGLSGFDDQGNIFSQKLNDCQRCILVIPAGWNHLFQPEGTFPLAHEKILATKKNLLNIEIWQVSDNPKLLNIGFSSPVDEQYTEKGFLRVTLLHTSGIFRDTYTISSGKIGDSTPLQVRKFTKRNKENPIQSIFHWTVYKPFKTITNFVKKFFT